MTDCLLGPDHVARTPAEVLLLSRHVLGPRATIAQAVTRCADLIVGTLPDGRLVMIDLPL